MLKAKRQSIRETLCLENAFDGFLLDETVVDEQGWNSNHPFLEAVISEVRPSLIVELGVWKGMSSIFMAGLVKRSKIQCDILAIDTWLGSSNHLAIEGRRAELKPEFGHPTVYRTFLSNVAKAGHTDIIVPLAMDGSSAAFALSRLNVKADLIHIDASHEYEMCLSDLNNYWSILADDGVFVVDDYGSWPGVTKAVCQFAAERDRPVFGTVGKAIVPKDRTLAFELRVRRSRRLKR